LEQCDALDLCVELSKAQKGIVPILLITGRLKKSFRDRALESGVTDFLSDQLDLEELETRIATGLKAATSRQKTEDLSLKIKVPKPANSSLKNKFVLNDNALRLLASAKNEKTPVALLFMRIDHFREGKIVQSFAQFVSGFLREKDVLIPSSEGGFVILLSNMTTDRARLVAEKLRSVIQQHPFETKEGPVHLTVSIAISSFEANEKDFNKMIDSAAKSLKAHSETNLIISLDQETP
jgi:diguanylate cyclase (GGDEF)-like protein